jgi:hypothetical protein
MLSIQNMILIMAGLFAFMAWWANSSKRNKILCRFRRVNKTIIGRFVKMTSRYIIFDGRKYDIVPRRIALYWYTAGIIHMLFPQWIASMDFSWFSRWPHDPDTMKVTMDDPAIRQAFNKEEWVESYYKGAKPSTQTKKKDFFSQWLPWIGVVAAVLVAFWCYQNLTAISHNMAAITNRLNAISPGK